jgi:hypothetical protein
MTVDLSVPSKTFTARPVAAGKITVTVATLLGVPRELRAWKVKE